MEWEYFLQRLIVNFIIASPWLIGGLGGLSIISFGPIGRALARRMLHGGEGSDESAVILEELAVIRHELEEVIERQYVTERLLTDHRGERSTPDLPTPPDNDEGVGTELST